MPRPPRQPPRETIEVTELKDYDAVVARFAETHPDADGSAGDYFGALLHSPPLAALMAAIGRQVRAAVGRGSYTDRQREVCALAISTALPSNLDFYLHVPGSLAAGVPLETIEALWHGRDERLATADGELVTYARQVAAGTVDDESFTALERRLGERGAIDYTLLAGFILCTLRIWQAIGLSDPSDEEVEALLAVSRPPPAASS